MKLKDYLHYYLYGNIYEAGVTTCQLIGIGDTYYTIKTKQGTLLTLSDRADIKLVLRRLRDMTSAEAIAIATMAMFDKMPDYPVRDYTVKRESMGNYPPSTCKVAINNDWHDMEIAIGFNTGNIWFTKFEQRVFNQPAIFHTLLQQNFDLFGLIDAGLAVDIKTITPTP